MFVTEQFLGTIYLVAPMITSGYFCLSHIYHKLSEIAHKPHSHYIGLTISFILVFSF